MTEGSATILFPTANDVCTSLVWVDTFGGMRVGGYAWVGTRGGMHFWACAELCFSTLRRWIEGHARTRTRTRTRTRARTRTRTRWTPTHNGALWHKKWQIESETESIHMWPLGAQVFYNPVQEFNRDLSISVLNRFSKMYARPAVVFHLPALPVCLAGVGWAGVRVSFPHVPVLKCSCQCASSTTIAIP